MAPDTHQIHDMSPGIAPSGLFWTIRIPDRWVSVESDDLGEGARYQIKNQHLLDYGKLAWAVAKSPGKIGALLKLRNETMLAAEKLAQALAGIIW